MLVVINEHLATSEISESHSMAEKQSSLLASWVSEAFCFFEVLELTVRGASRFAAIAVHCNAVAAPILRYD